MAAAQANLVFDSADGIATQSSEFYQYPAENANDQNFETYAHTNNGYNNVKQWWQVKFTGTQEIRSVFISTREFQWSYQDTFAITVGGSTDGFANDVCFSPITQSGWYSCTTMKSGTYFSIIQLTQEYIHFREVLAYSEYYIQHVSSAELSSTYTGSSAEKALAQGGLLHYSTSAESASTTLASGATQTYKIVLRAQELVKKIVVISAFDSYQNYSLFATRYENEANITCQNSSDDLRTSFEFVCDQRVQSVTITQNLANTQLKLVSVGILIDCDCAEARIKKYLYPQIESGQWSTIVVEVGAAPVSNTYSIYDTVSLNCGNTDGYTYCGPRTFLYFKNQATNAYDDTLIQWAQDASSHEVTFTIQATSISWVGSNQYEGYAQIDVQSERIKYFSGYMIEVSATSICLNTAFVDFDLESSLQIILPLEGSLSFNLPQDTVSKTDGNNDGYTLCGNRMMQLIEISGAVEIAIDLTTSTTINYLDDVLTFTPTEEGTTSYRLQFSLEYVPEAPMLTKSFTVEVLDCASTILDPIEVNTDQLSIELPMDPLESPYISINEVPQDSVSESLESGGSYCGNRVMSLVEDETGDTIDTSTSEIVSFDSASNSIYFSPTAEGTYNYTLQFGLEEWPDVAKTTQVLTLSVTLACLSTKLDQIEQDPDVDTLYILVGQQDQIQLIEPSDSKSTARGNETYCGNRVLVIEETSSGQIDLSSSETVTYDSETGALTFKPLVEGTYVYSFYYYLEDYPSIQSSLRDINIVATNSAPNTVPYFVNAGPGYQYTVAPGSVSDLSFSLLDTEQNEFTVEVDLGTTDFVTPDVSPSSDGGVTITLNIAPAADADNKIHTFTITVTEVYDADSCPEPLSFTRSFELKVVEEEVPAVTEDETETKVYVPILEEKEETENADYTVVIDDSIPIEIRIESISRVGLIKVVYNQPLDIDFSQLLVLFDQLSDEPLIQFNSTIEGNESQSFLVSCNFSKPLSVSAGNTADRVVLYVDVNTHNATKGKVQYKLVENLPLLVASQQELDKLNQISELAGDGSRTLFWIYLVLNVVFSFALGMLWGTFQTLQVIIAMPLLMVKMPANVLQVFQGFSDIVNMKIVESKDVVAWITNALPALRLGIQKAHQAQVQTLTDAYSLSKDSTNSTLRLLQANQTSSDSLDSETPDEAAAQFLNMNPDNLVPDIIFAVVALVVLIFLIGMIFVCIKCVYPKAPKFLKDLIMKLKHKLMWGSLLRYVTQSYLSTAIVCTTSLSTFTSLPLTQQILSPLTLVYLMAVPACIYFLLYRHRADLHKDEYKASIGTLYMNYETDKKSVFHFTMCFLYRRLFFAAVLAFGKANIVLQVWISYMMSLVMLMYVLKWQPMEADSYDFLAIFNEAVLCVSLYMMLLYTEYVPDPELRYYYGEYLLNLLYFNVALNLFLLVLEVKRLLARDCKKRISHKKLRKQRKMKIQEIEIVRQAKQLVIQQKQQQRNMEDAIDELLNFRHDGATVKKGLSLKESQRNDNDLDIEDKRSVLQAPVRGQPVGPMRVASAQPSQLSELSDLDISKSLSIYEDGNRPFYRVAQNQNVDVSGVLDISRNSWAQSEPSKANEILQISFLETSIIIESRQNLTPYVDESIGMQELEEYFENEKRRKMFL